MLLFEGSDPFLHAAGNLPSFPDEAAVHGEQIEARKHPAFKMRDVPDLQV